MCYLPQHTVQKTCFDRMISLHNFTTITVERDITEWDRSLRHDKTLPYSAVMSDLLETTRFFIAKNNHMCRWYTRKNDYVIKNVEVSPRSIVYGDTLTYTIFRCITQSTPNISTFHCNACKNNEIILMIDFAFLLI